ncbi:nucleoside/nucleotide kinase family protein [Streptomyces johnsoniae]|uniref:Uncharacterized protein n=1 Tax=Streptomyces johnsoniae TaxID=3075532 RepID=A0ABU2S5Q7_9ACTN|nr:hypothetical protein [Streptomyces sp. DSM 41886]MDT0444309.1 hypothetical protein [Streptomyces sp. DSM 41886]
MVLLSAPAAVLMDRVAARTGNPYGKRPEERAAILADLAGVEPLLRATADAEIDATAPLACVVRQLEALARRPAAVAWSAVGLDADAVPRPAGPHHEAAGE